MKAMNQKSETRSQKFSAMFAKRITGTIYSSSDPFTFVIKGHVLVDAFITSIINGSLLKPSKLNLDRVTYENKIILCVAFGLIHDEVMPVLQKLGKIRNGFAHKLWPAFENKEALDFINTLGQSQLLRTRFSEIQPQNDVSRLQDAIYVTCMYLFEQLVRIASTKSKLNEFWAKTVDNLLAQKEPSVEIMNIVGPLSASEKKLFNNPELIQLRSQKKGNSGRTKTGANKRLNPDAG
jgi:hypothetical protein